MLLNDLSLSSTASSTTVKQAVEQRLREYLPEGSFTVILRNYQGDFRSRNNNVASYYAMILLDNNGKQAALQRRADLEASGFQVSPSGEIKITLN